MPKRPRIDDMAQLHQRDLDFEDIRPPSPDAPMPGSWNFDAELVYIPTVTCFETVAELASCVTLNNILSFTWEKVRRCFRRQRIRAHPVLTHDGYSNKKQLLDNGLGDSVDCPRVKRDKSKSAEQYKPKFTRNYILPRERVALHKYLTPGSMPGGWTDDERLLVNRLYEGTDAFHRDQLRATQPEPDPMDTSPDLSSPAFASTPLGSSASRKILTPVSPKKAQKTATAAHHQGPSSPSPQSHLVGVFNKALRKVQDSAAPILGFHTSLEQGAPIVSSRPACDSQSPQNKTFRKTAAYLLAVDQVAEEATKANAIFKASCDARIKGVVDSSADDEPKEAIEPTEANEPTEAIEPVEVKPAETKEPTEANEAFDYQNDLSELPDAPEKKTVKWAEKNRIRPFHQAAKIGDDLDSHLEDMKSCPSPIKALAQRKALGQPVDPPQLPVPSEGPLVDVDASGTDVSASGDPLSSLVLSEAWQHKEEELRAAEPPPAPAAPPPKPLISDLSESELKNLIEAAKLSQNGMVKDHKYVRGIVAHDLSTLLPRLFSGDPQAWLNDNIINEYLALLVEHCRKAAGWKRQPDGPPAPVHAFASQWYANFTKDYSHVEKWPKRFNLVGANLLGSELILIPICEHAHWTLLVIRPRERRIEYLDSLGGKGRPYTDAALKWLAAELKKAFIPSEWSVGGAAKSQRQANLSDCGVFTLLNALVVLRGEDHKRVDVVDGMEAARRRIAVSLLAKGPTGEF